MAATKEQLLRWLRCAVDLKACVSVYETCVLKTKALLTQKYAGVTKENGRKLLKSHTLSKVLCKPLGARQASPGYVMVYQFHHLCLLQDDRT